MGCLMDSVMWSIVWLGGFGVLVLMARVAVAMAFHRSGSPGVGDAYDREKASYYTALAKDYDRKALRWDRLHDPEQAEHCRELARQYYLRAERRRLGDRT
jgi:hypothetical protein